MSHPPNILTFSFSKSHKNVVCDGYVKYEEHRQQEFRDNKKKIKNSGQSVILDFILVKFVIFERDTTFCFIFMVQIFCNVLELRQSHKITQIAPKN